MTLRRIFLPVMAILAVGLFLWARARYPGKATVKLPAERCNRELWRHVYEPERLKVLEPCTAVQGRVVALDRGSDGDLHIALDPEQKSVLNLMNATHGGRHLPAEVICEHAASKLNATAACRNFASPIQPPKIGDRVRVTGAYVTDRDNGWNEVHPVTRIEVLAAR